MADSGFRHELDINTLSWVKSEIDTTLEQAHKALEAYEESPEDDSQIKFCLNYLHQVHGTLKMVELYGASLVAEELESLTLALSEGKVSNKDETFQVLIKGMVQLPDYLENLLSGHKDMPVVLLPLLNDMRAARNENLLTENALFSPNMDIVLPAEKSVLNPSGDIQSLAKKLRHSYHLGLLHWFTDKNVPAGIKLVSKVVNQLREASNDAEVNKLLWIVSGVMEGLNEGGLDSSIAVKLLAGNVDREIKKIIDNGEMEIQKEPPVDLIKNLLYYVSCSSSNGEVVTGIKQAFKLQDIMPNPKMLEKARADLEGPNAALMRTVSTVLMDELTQVKDNLDVFVRSETKDIEQLKPLSSALSQMSDTLGMLGLGIQRATIREQKQRLDSMISGEQEVNDSELMDVAGSLLSVENSLNDLGQLKGNKFNSDTVEQTLQSAEKQKLLKSVISEAKVDLSNVKESLSAFSRDPSNHELLTDIPGFLSQIQGSLSILNLTRASSLLDECNQFIKKDLIAEQSVPELATLETLADAISSIEYFLESLAENWGQPDAILEVAEQSLKKIRGEAFSLGGNSDSQSKTDNDSLSPFPQFNEDALENPEVNETQEIGFDTQIEIDSTSLELENDSAADADASEVINIDEALDDLDSNSLSLDDTGNSVELDETNLTDSDATQEIKLDDALDSLDPNSLSLDEDTGVVNLNYDGTQSEEFILEQGLSLEVDNEPSFKLDSNESDEQTSKSGLDLNNENSNATELTFDSDTSPPDSEGSPDPFDLGKLDDLPPTEEIITSEARTAIVGDQQNVIDELPATLTAWYESSDNEQATEQLRTLFDKINLQLKETGNDNALKIVHDMEGIFNCVVNGEESFNDDLINTLNWAKDTLLDLVDNSKDDLELDKTDNKEINSFTDLDPIIDPIIEPNFEPELELDLKAVEEVNKPEVTNTGRTFLADIDEEIIEIFMEEAQEEFDNIIRLYSIWKEDTSDESSLKDMRRSFHTLKGSGRLVGAVELGEFSWAFENMLNHIIDGAIEITPHLFEALNRAVKAFPTLYDQITTGEKLGHEILQLMEVAESLSLGKDIELSGFLQNTDNTAVTENNVLVENENSKIDNSLGDIFESEEFQINQSGLSDANISNENVYSLNVDDSNEINTEIKDDGALTVEIVTSDFDKLKLESGSGSDLNVVDLEVQNQELNLPKIDTPHESVDNDSKISAENIISLDHAIENNPTIDDIKLDEFSPIAAINSEDLELEDDDDLKDTTELEFDENKSSGGLQQELDTSSTDEIDPILLDIYTNEAKTHIESLHQYVFNWKKNNIKNSTPDLVRALHTLKGSSRTAGFIELADICGEFEKVTKFLEDKIIELDQDVLECLEENIVFAEQIIATLEDPENATPDGKPLLAKVIAMHENIIHIEPNKLIEAIPESQAIDSFSPQQSPVSHDYDEELLEIFLEEGIEILEDSDHCIHDWKNDIDNSKHIEALQRYLHTLKGGARMAGITEVGNLAHSTESVLMAVVQGDLDINDDVFNILQKSHDQLLKMLEQIASRQALDTGEFVLKQIDAFLAGEPILDIEIDEDFKEPSTEELPTEENLIQDTNENQGTQESNLELDTQVNNIDSEAIADVDIEHEIKEEPEEEFDESKLAGTISEFLYENLSDTSDIVDLDDNVVLIDSSGLPSNLETVTADLKPNDKKDISTRRSSGEQVRVRADLLDSLVNFAGEVSIYRSRMEQQVNTFRYNLVEFDDTVLRLRSQLRQFEIETETQMQSRYQNETGKTHADFDPLEFDRFTQMQQLSRGMLESLNDLDSLRGILSNLTRESETLLVQQSRVNTELQEGLMRTRMVPFSGQVSRLRRIVRQTAEELDKQVELKLLGVENEIDRTVLERILAPLEHMLRNAIAHGIESPEVRKEKGKPEKGVIEFIVGRDGSDLLVTISDDGQGLNLDAIHQKAIELGKIEADADVSDQILFDMILEPGFSTAEDVTQISGRGVGMDVVNSEVQQLGGVFHLESESGVGSKFSIRLPLTLSITRALMVNIADETFALPLLSVQGIERISATDVRKMLGKKNETYHWVGQDFKLIHLASEMGLAKAQIPSETKMMPLLLVQSGEYRAAIIVDHLIGSREVVVKNIGPELSILRGISGATIMGDGSVVLILDLGLLIQLTMSLEDEVVLIEPVEEETEKVPNIMVVDDSITVRKVTTRFLERNEMNVITAKDGVDALAQLLDFVPDVMLLDVEMPRMDGFELANNMRNDDRLKNIPIIMITSRTGEKHRDRAMEIGVNAYLGKPYQEIELLENIQTLLNK